MDHNYYIKGEQVELKPLDFAHLESLRLLRNKYSQYFVNNGHISEEDQNKWYQRYLNKDDDIMFYISTPTNEFSGVIALYDIHKRIAEFGRIVIDEFAPRHTGYNSIITLINFAKNELNIDKVICSVLKNNKKAIHVYEKIGFQKYRDEGDLIYLYKNT